MKVLMLDFDGVLNSAQSAELYYGLLREDKSNFITFKSDLAEDATSSDFCPIAVSNLNYILKNIPDLKIVVSSFWRWGRDVEALREIFTWLGLPADRIIDVTPIIHGVARGTEILKWLELNPECTEYAVIDDDTDLDGIDFSRFVHIDSYNGLTYTDSMKMVSLFK